MARTYATIRITDETRENLRGLAEEYSQSMDAAVQTLLKGWRLLTVEAKHAAVTSPWKAMGGRRARKCRSR